MSQQNPFFSVVVPTYNRPVQLGTCLFELSRQNYPREGFEVIVVDDGSTIPLKPVVARFLDGLDVRLLRQRNGGPASARNLGAAQARGSHLVFTDDDCLPEQGWLAALAARVERTPNCAISGRKRNSLADNPYAAASQAITDIACEHFNSNTAEKVGFVSSSNLAFPRDHFLRIGGFDPAFRTAEDRELADRWRDRGHSIVCAPEVLVYHANPLTLATFCRQHFQFGRGAFRFHAKRVDRGEPGLRPDLAFYMKLLKASFNTLPFWRGVRGSLLILTAQLANATGYCCERIGSARRRTETSWVSNT